MILFNDIVKALDFGWPMARRPSVAPSSNRSGQPKFCLYSAAIRFKADCNPLWTAPAVPVAHATGARRRMRRYESKANGSSL
ncbi:hypothetical protein FW320_22825 [Azospirillum sp. Vi22]|nr:hypothetical protein [Azospirillum baldaniorum]